MGLLSGGRSDDEDLDELEDEENEEEDDDVAPRSKKKASSTESTAARVRALIDAGATSKAELVEDLGADASHRIDVQLAHMTKRGEIERTGRGTFKKIGGGKPHAASPRVKRAKAAKVAMPKVADVSRAPSSGRFTLRVAGAEIDCATASDVAELVRALGRS